MTHRSSEKVTVLVNNYNYAEYVCDAIRSVLFQSRPADEVIVVDDGSTDGSVDTIETEFKEEASVRILSKPNGGQLSAFNAGYGLSTGDLIFFLDSDDLYEPAYLESAVDFYRRYPECGFLHCGIEKFGEASEAVLGHPTDQDYGFSVVESLMSPHWRGEFTSSISVRRPILDRFLPLDLELDWPTRADDCLVWGSAIAGAHKFFLAKLLVRYRVHDRNAWHGMAFPRHYETSREYKLNRLAGRVAERCGYYLPGILDRLVMEFESAGSGRSMSDLVRYRSIVSRSDRSWRWRRSQRKHLLRAYLRMRWRSNRRQL